MKQFDEIVNEQVRTRTPQSIKDIIADSLSKIDDCKNRLDKEGLVVRDLKGSIVPHPAIKIQNEQSKIVSDMFDKWR